MLRLLVSEMPAALKREPRLVVKYITVAIILSLIGRSMMVAAHDGADVPKFYAQFVSTLPMLLINFMAYKYVMGRPELRFRSHVGAKWSKAYVIEFVLGHSAFIIFALKLGYNYVAVSTAIGMAAFIVSLGINLLVFGYRSQRTVPAPPSLAH